VRSERLGCAPRFPVYFAHALQALLMCQLQHPNLVGAEDVYLPSDIPLEHSDSALRLQRSIADYICVRMPYFPADMAWLIHSSTQALTPEHVQVTAAKSYAQSRCFNVTPAFSTYSCRFCEAFGPIPLTIFNNLLLTHLPRYMHAAEVIHRDLKPSNMCVLFAVARLRFSSRGLRLSLFAFRLVGEDCDVHICDFGLARRERDSLLSQYIVTRWYRPPEVLLCKRQYNKAVDIWSAGCIFAELVTRPSPHRQGLFPGFSYKDQTDKIIQVILGFC
jgi:serine/threonine protein kinase